MSAQPASGCPPSAAERRRAYADRTAYLAAAVGGRLDEGGSGLGGGSLWGAVARAHVLLHGDGDLDAAHGVLVGAVGAVGAVGDDPGTTREALTAAFDTLTMICRFADRPALWSPVRELAARHSGQVLPGPITSEPGTGHVEVDRLDPAGAVRAGWSLLPVDDLQRCRPALYRALDHGLRGDAAGTAVNAAVLLVLDAHGTGRWDDAIRLAEQGRALAVRHGHETLAVLAVAGSALVAACRGDEVGCRDHTSAMAGWAAPRAANLIRQYAAQARALAALGRGDAEGAYHHAYTVARPGQVEPAGLGRLLVMDLVEAAVRTGRHDEAAAHVRAAREAGLSAVSARSALIVGGAAALAERGSLSRQRYEEALAVPGAQAWPFDVARVRLAYGESLRRSRATVAARPQLTTALAIFRGLRAEPWIARAESELRAAGHRATRARDIATAALSHQERTVAELAATGETNRQIGEHLGLSPRTVGSHLSRVFVKLSVTSRAALGESLRSAEPTGDRD